MSRGDISLKSKILAVLSPGLVVLLIASLIATTAGAVTLTWYYSGLQQSKAVDPDVYIIAFDPIPEKMQIGKTYDFIGSIRLNGVPVPGITANLIVNNTMIYATGLTDDNGKYNIQYTIKEPAGTVYNWKVGIEV